jgi:tRNA threonylcarbamoyladenosine biosynthesis protein TsaE
MPGCPNYHFDFYRFAQADEWRDAGFDEYFGSRGACLVEWPELAGPALPLPDLRIELQWTGTRQAPDGDTGRVARLDAFSEAGLQCLKAVAAGF